MRCTYLMDHVLYFLIIYFAFIVNQNNYNFKTNLSENKMKKKKKFYLNLEIENFFENFLLKQN
jgi:hypothetical protein